jgi:hypothetical protein
LSGQNPDGFPIPNGERSNWDFLSGVTPVVDKGNFFPVDYVYHELFNELAEICRLGNEYVDDFFQRVMHIYCIFPESDKPSDQEIFYWFSYLISIPEGYDMDNQIILIHKIQI